MDIFIILAIVVLVLLVIVSLASYGGDKFFNAFFDYQEQSSVGFITATEFTQMVVKNELNREVKIVQNAGILNDAYNPAQKIIMLSSTTAFNASSVALGVAAHELGHALQQKEAPKTFENFIRMRAFSVLFSPFILPLIIIGIIYMLTIDSTIWIGAGISMSGLAIFLICLFVRLATIPIEKDASKRAIALMKKYTDFDSDELKLVKKLLNLALLTYIGDFFRACFMWTGLVRKTKL